MRSNPPPSPASRARALLARIGGTLERRSRTLVARLPQAIERAIPVWIVLVAAAAALRIMASPTAIRDVVDFAWLALPYALIALAPVAALRIAGAAFAGPVLPAQPALRLARVGTWRRLDPVAARDHPAFGPFGFMASLMIGMLLNVPVRTIEFVLAIPAMNANAPAWGSTLFMAMAAEVMAMNFLYIVCLVMALRSVPAFPRMLVVVWMLDIMAQLAIANRVAAAPGLPQPVAAAMVDLLTANTTKVLISAAIWLPYLLLSPRVNVTYRSRAPGGSG